MAITYKGYKEIDGQKNWFFYNDLEPSKIERPKIDFKKMKKDLPYVEGESLEQIEEKHIKWLKDQMSPLQWEQNEADILMMLTLSILKNKS